MSLVTRLTRLMSLVTRPLRVARGEQIPQEATGASASDAYLSGPMLHQVPLTSTRQCIAP